MVLACALAVKLALWPNKHTVFPIYHAAVQACLAGESPYDPLGEGLDYFRYPPPSLWLFLPYGCLDLRLGGALWGISSVAITFIGLVRLLRYAIPGSRSWTDFQVGAFLLVGLAVALRGLWNAQANGFLGGMIFLSVAELARGRAWFSTLAMAGALLLKPTMLSIPMLIAAWRPVWGLRLLASLAGIVLVAMVPAPNQSAWLWQKWLEHGKSSAGERRPAFRDAWTLALTMVDTVTPGEDSPPLGTPYSKWYYPAIPGVFAFMALATGWWLTRGMAAPAAVSLLAALGTCWMLLFGPAIEHPTYLLAAPWLAWAVVRNREAGDWRIAGVLAGICCLFLVFFAGGLSASKYLPLLTSAMPLAMVCLTAWLLAWAILQQKDRPTDKLST